MMMIIIISDDNNNNNNNHNNNIFVFYLLTDCNSENGISMTALKEASHPSAKIAIK
jgi:hypothetical protein